MFYYNKNVFISCSLKKNFWIITKKFLFVSRTTFTKKAFYDVSSLRCFNIHSHKINAVSFQKYLKMDVTTFVFAWANNNFQFHNFEIHLCCFNAFHTFCGFCREILDDLSQVARQPICKCPCWGSSSTTLRKLLLQFLTWHFLTWIFKLLIEKQFNNFPWNCKFHKFLPLKDV